eukprot:scaffold79385_cov64-Phaeocystis_antarctica.AAC.8
MASRRSSTQFPFTPMRGDDAPGASAAKRGCAAAFQVASLSRWAICAARSGCTASLAGAEKARASEEIITEPPCVWKNLWQYNKCIFRERSASFPWVVQEDKGADELQYYGRV